MFKVTVTFRREALEDYDPDISYLEGKRLTEYRKGDFGFIAIRAVALIRIDNMGHTTLYELASPGLFGIESDSDESYLEEVFKEECDTLKDDIKCFAHAEFI